MRQHPSINWLILWILLVTISWSGVFFSWNFINIFPHFFHSVFLTGIAEGCLASVPMALIQAFLLKKYINKYIIWFIVSPIFPIFRWVAFSEGDGGWVFLFVANGFLIGIIQWLVLREEFEDVQLWIYSSGLGFLLAEVLSILFMGGPCANPASSQFFWSTLICGAVYGSASGFSMFKILCRQRV